MLSVENKQSSTIDMEDSASPNAALESVILTYKIDAEEDRDVAIIDTSDILIQTRSEYE